MFLVLAYSLNPELIQWWFLQVLPLMPCYHSRYIFSFITFLDKRSSVHIRIAVTST